MENEDDWVIALADDVRISNTSLTHNQTPKLFLIFADKNQYFPKLGIFLVFKVATLFFLFLGHVFLSTVSINSKFQES